jgi:hypothetical protein
MLLTPKTYRVVCDPCLFYGGIHESERGQILGPFTGWFAFWRAKLAAWTYVLARPYGMATVQEKKS